MTEQLSSRDRAILDFETEWWTLPGRKDQLIRERFGLTAVRYYQLLNALIDRPRAAAHAPLTVKRLQRLRSRRVRAGLRAGRATGPG
jgi:hypothetical protein